MDHHASDEIGEHIDRHLQALIASAVRLAEAAKRARQQRMETLARESRDRQAQYAAQLAAQRDAARADYARVNDPEWWATATPEEIAATYETARRWENDDPEAARAAAEMDRQIQERYGLDARQMDPNSEELNAAVAESRLGPGGLGVEEEAAAFLSGAAAADEAAYGRYIDNGGTPIPDVERLQGNDYDGEWDSPERRQANVDRLSNAGVDADVIEAAHLADVSQGTHVGAIAEKQGTSAEKVHSAGAENVQAAEVSL